MSERLLPAALAKLGPRELLLNETFSSVQGEGSYAGVPCFFIRLTGCHLRCTWCDTEYAFFEGQPSTVDEMVEAARDAGLELVELTGGEPLLQKAALPLMKELCDAGHRVLVETSGAVRIDAIDPRVLRIVDWKAPGSGEVNRNRSDVLDALKPGDELKIVVADRDDYEWTREFLRNFRRDREDVAAKIPVHLSPVFDRCKSEDLVRWILEDRLDVRLNLQLHKFIWDPKQRGV
ncbi:MAG: radical SAM protein [Planctomycetota bacterium]